MKKLLFIFAFLASFLICQAATVTDEIKIDNIPELVKANQTNYTDFSGLHLNSDAVYAGKMAKDKTANIQLNSTSPYGIVTTKSGGKVKSITINFASANTAVRTINVYGKNTAYTSAADLYGDNAGEKIGSVTNTANVEYTGKVTVQGDYEYIGIRSNDKALYLSSVVIEWEQGEGTNPNPNPNPDPEPTGEVQYVKTDLANLQTGDVIVVVDTSYPYALDPNGTSAPKATTVTLSDDKITAGVTDNMELKITISGSGANATFNLEQASGTSAGSKMYMLGSSNDGVRFAKNTSGTTTFSIDGNHITGTVGSTYRYIGVYNTNHEWRSYTSVNTNIQNTKTAFYKKVIKGEDPDPITTCAAPVFNPAFGEVKAETEVEVTCATNGAKLNLLIKKGDEVVVEEPAAEFPITFTVSEPVSVEAYTYTADDKSDKSETVKGSYTVYCADPVFDPAPGKEEAVAVEYNEKVTVTCDTKGAKLYIVALDDQGEIVINNEAAVLPFDFNVKKNMTISAYTYLNDDVKSNEVEGEYTVYCAAPVFDPELGSAVDADSYVTVTCTTPGAKLCILATSDSGASDFYEDEASMPFQFKVTETVSVTAYTYIDENLKSKELEGEYTIKTSEFDVITADLLKATNTTYVGFSGVKGKSGAVYLGYSGKKEGNITLSTTNSKSGIVSNESGGKVKSITINFAEPKQVDIYGKNTSYLSATELYNASKQGKKLGDLSATGTLSIEGDYRYIGIRSKSGAVSISSIEIEWEKICEVPEFNPALNSRVEAGREVTVTCQTPGAKLNIMVIGNEKEIIEKAANMPYTFTLDESVMVEAYTYLTEDVKSETTSGEYYVVEVDKRDLFTVATDIEPGYDYLIAGKKSNVLRLIGNIKTNSKGDVLDKVEAEGNFVVTDDGDIVVTSDNVARVRFEPAENGKYYVHYRLGDAEGYYITPVVTAQYNNIETTSDKADAMSATVLVDANGIGSIVYDVETDYSGLMSYNGNSNADYFSLYKSKRSDIYLYKCEEGTSPVTYYRSRAILEDVDYVFVGATDAGHYVMTGYNDDAKTFGSTHEKINGDVTMLGGGYHLTVTDPQVTVVNFVKKEATQNGVRRSEAEATPATEWAMKIKDGQHIARGENGQAELSDDPDHVTFKIVEGKDGYMAYLVHGDGQNFQFDGTGFSSSSEAATPLYIYATKVPVEGDAVKFADEASNSVILTIGFNESRQPITQSFDAVNMPKGSDDFIYIYYDGLATLDDAKNMSDDELSWRYKYNDSDWFKVEAADQEQTSKVAMHVEVEMLGDEKGENLSYKKANPDVPGDWTSNDYIKYNGVNQVYMADTDQPYIKVPAISKYSIVTATATGDKDTHIGDAAATQRVYVRADDNGTTSIEAIDFDPTEETRYYNLQGVRVYNPGSGIYIRVQGRTATKVNIVR